MKNWIIRILFLLLIVHIAAAKEPIGFSGMEMFKFDYGIQQLKTADLNNDGFTDIVMVNNYKAKIEILANKGPDWQTEDADRKEVIDNINVINYDSRFKVETLPLTQRVDALCTFDMNNDKKLDLVFIGNPGGLFIYLQKDDFRFEKEKNVRIEDIPETPFLSCTDLKNDGIPYILVVTKNKMLVFNTKEDKALSHPDEIPLEENFVNGIKELFVEDINGNGKKDLLFAVPFMDESVWVKFQTSTGDFGPFKTYSIDKYRSLQLEDIDNNGKPELVYIQTVSGRVLISEIVNFDKKKQSSRFTEPAIYPYPSQEAKERDLALGDINGDGFTDIVISEPKISAVSSFIQDPSATFNRFQVFPSLVEAETVIIDDITPAEGNEVLIFSKKENVIGISKFEKSGVLSFPDPIKTEGKITAVNLADMNGDGKNDLIYGAEIQEPKKVKGVVIRLKTEDGSFSKEEIRITPKDKFRSSPEKIVIFDADGNGLNDLFVFVPFEKNFRIFLQEKEGSFNEISASPSFDTGIIEKVKEENFSVSDLDGDGKKEFIITRNNFARILTIQDNNIKIMEQINSPLNGTVAAVIPMDIDGKAPSELLLHDSQFNRLFIMQTKNGATFEPIDTIEVKSIDVSTIRVKDINSDGREDILLQGGKAFGILFQSPEKTGIELVDSYETRIKDGVYGYLLCEDFSSGNGKDIILLEASNHIIEFLSVEKKKISHSLKFKTYETGPGNTQRDYSRSNQQQFEPREMKVADVTGDGLADLITIIHDRVIVYIQE